MLTKLLYTAASCNQKSGCVKAMNHKNDGYLVYASFNSIVVAKQFEKNKGGIRVIQTLNSHKELICGLSCSASYLTSVSTDGQLLIYQLLESGLLNVTNSRSLPTNLLFSCSDCINYCDASNNELFFVAIAFSDVIHIYDKCDDKPVGSIVNQKLCLSIHLCVINEMLLLFLGLENGHIEVYFRDSSNNYVHLHTMFGHSEWITSLDSQYIASEKCVLLASASQDEYVRLWKISCVDNSSTKTQVSDSINDEGHNSLKISLESVCAGHDNWVKGLKLHPFNKINNSEVHYMISCSMDCSIILWKQIIKKGEKAQPWLENQRFGTVGEQALGLLDCTFSNDGQYMYCLGLRGNISVWHHNDNLESWEEQPPILGHAGPVTDLSWSKQDQFMCFENKIEPTPYLLTCGQDQTVRLHKCWPQSDTWHEFGRPQIHGYDMNTVRCIAYDSYISGGDEKVIRVFSGFAEPGSSENKDPEKNSNKSIHFESGAMQPALGLSNFQTSAGDKSQFLVPDEPLDDTRLHKETLWPEIKKLYGHSYEIYALAVHPNMKYVASSCKSSKQIYAEIIIWNVKDWSIHQRLVHHQLTVVTLKFSPTDGEKLLAGSRDRSWSVHSMNSDSGQYTLAAQSPHSSKGGHSRIIWTSAWTPDSKYFLTGSRDKTIGLWDATHELGKKISSDQFQSAITALDVTYLKPNNGEYLCAIGQESGSLSLCLLKIGDSVEWNIVVQIPRYEAHLQVSVRATQFNRQVNGKILLASGGDDGLVRIHEVIH